MNSPRLASTFYLKIAQERHKKDVGVLYFLLIPPSGSRIALTRDKQRQQAHAKAYINTSPVLHKYPVETVRTYEVHFRWTLRCAIFLVSSNLRDLKVEDKRP